MSVRTLRFYDRGGLLSPAERSLSGHRLYADSDLVTLERILGLKMLGFTLIEIKALLTVGPRDLPTLLAQQRAMLRERQTQIERALRAIGEVEARLGAGDGSPDLLLRIIEAMNMSEDKSWVRKHLTEEQRAATEEIVARTTTPEARERLQGREWTEAQQRETTEAWNAVYADAGRLAEQGADPAGPEAQAVARRYNALIQAFTGGDPEVEASLMRFYAEARELPPEKSPYPAPDPKAREFAERAYMAHRDQN